MTHESRLPQCQDMANKLDRHIDESGPVRLEVQKHSDQVRTLEEARLASMEDAKVIKSTLVAMDLKIETKNAEIKSWIQTAAISVLLILLGEALYFGGILKQVEINTKRLDQIEAAIRPVQVHSLETER